MLLIKKIYRLAIGVSVVSMVGALVSNLTRGDSPRVEKRVSKTQTTYYWDAGSDGGFEF